LTPRQIAAYLFLSERRRERENYAALAIAALGASGDGKQIQKQLDEWEKQQ